MTNLSNYLANKLLGHAFGEAAYTSPTCYLGLFTTAPTMPAATGGSEVTGGAYARQTLAAIMAAPASETIASSATISFPQPPHHGALSPPSGSSTRQHPETCCGQRL